MFFYDGSFLDEVPRTIVYRTVVLLALPFYSLA
jgi:hypothetical protein